MTILEEIFQTKREEVRISKGLVSPQRLRAQAAEYPPRRGFLKALKSASQRPSLIAEVKRASPSQGQIVMGAFEPKKIAATYVEAGAACLSVLTDVKYFSGSAEYLQAVRQVVEIPLLRKDFIFDEYQLDESILWGADCILLIVAGLDRDLLRHLYMEARARGLDVLVEVHDEPETEAALALGPDLIGINNRDLSTFKTDITTTEKLIKMMPESIFKVSESALHSKSDVQRVVRYGAQGVLIGTAFCESNDIGAKVREVMDW